MLSNTPIQSLVDAGITYASMQTYVMVMVALVIVMTVLDMMHKKSAQYFFEKAAKEKQNATKTAPAASILVKTIVTDVALSGEFCNQTRRLVHLLTMYGFISFNVATAMMIFGDNAADSTLNLFWHLGAISLFVGSWWFWFVFKVDVAAEGNTWTNIEIRRDMFSLSLMATSTTALVWSLTGGGTGVWFILVILSTASLFGGVYWSKFSHMFFKPAAAYNKRTVHADGSNENLPEIPDLASAELHARFPDIPEYMGKNPGYMGLGIKNEEPKHY
ncbi:MAG: adenylylsulfate reductase [Gammaproteobacteria bacterium]|uniref:Adenylylsulfate reductase n=1 Tax=Candidatus Thiopontia autotrophica TaxID=2841688 RepID=A0A8J6P948_9GAMM|nr:adenylylsulfate reductase [Candidatus Thiopontia autotrophica]MBL6968860.1 adenylylsulfate reductase [Gammaproteobacteria bacterium]